MTILQEAFVNLVSRCESEEQGLLFVEKVLSSINSQVLPALQNAPSEAIRLLSCNDVEFIEVLKVLLEVDGSKISET